MNSAARLALVAAVCLAIMPSTMEASAEQRLRWPTASFSGLLDIQNGEARGPRQVTMRVFSAGHLLRLDIQQDGQPLSLIVNRKARRMVALSHERKKAVVLPYRRQSDIAQLFTRARGQLSREGVETVNGVRATRYKFEGRNADGDTFTGQVWITRQRIIVRLLETEKRPGKARPFQMNLRDLKVGKLPAGTFGVPKGYAVVDASKRAPGKGAQ